MLVRCSPPSSKQDLPTNQVPSRVEAFLQVTSAGHLPEVVAMRGSSRVRWVPPDPPPSLSAVYRCGWRPAPPRIISTGYLAEVVA